MILQKIRENKIHVFFIALLLISAFIVFSDFFSGNYWVQMRGDVGIPKTGTDFAYHASNFYVLKESLSRFHIPFWSPYTLGGMPFFAKPQLPAFNFSWIILILSPTAWQGLKLAYMFHFILAGIGMYLFMYFYIKEDAKISFITALAYMLNRNLVSEVWSGHMNVINVYAFLPFILLFLLLALSSKKWASNSVFAAIGFSLLLLGGSAQELIFTGVFIFLLMAANIFGKNIFKRIFKTVLVGLVFALVFFGLSAVKLLPSIDLVKTLNVRAEGLSYEALVGDGTINIMNAAPLLFATFGISFVFILFAFQSAKKKKILLIFSLLLFGILLLSRSFLMHLLWQYFPFINKIRGAYKVLVLLIFPFSVLIGIGISNLSKIAESKFKFRRENFLNFAVLLLASAALANVLFFGSEKMMFDDIRNPLSKNQAMNYMADDREIFRFNQVETNGIDWGTDMYSVPLGLQEVYGYDNVWNFNYMPVYLGVAQSKPDKMLGILNLKYLTSQAPVNISGFSLVKKFEKCGDYDNGYPICQPRKSDGPYLYKNGKFLPRARMAENAVLVLGDENALNIVYFLMLNEKFDEKSTIVLMENSMVNLEQEALNAIDIFVIAKQPGESDVAVLRAMKDKGKKILPDIFANEGQISEEKFVESISSLKSKNADLEPLDIKYESNDRLFVAAKESGFVMMSEQYSIYPGWKSYINSKEKKIYRANGIFSAVYADGQESVVEFEYSPKSFMYGAIITVGTILVLISGALFSRFRKKEIAASS